VTICLESRDLSTTAPFIHVSRIHDVVDSSSEQDGLGTIAVMRVVTVLSELWSRLSGCGTLVINRGASVALSKPGKDPSRRFRWQTLIY
jgi:hypothetical protein